MLVICMVAVCADAAAKKKNVGKSFKTGTWVGVNGTVDYSGGATNLGIGVTFEQQFSKHCGYEVGGYYRNQTHSIYGYGFHPSVGAVSANADVRMSYLSVPLMFKYYSRILNFTAGLNVDAYLGYKTLNASEGTAVTSLSADAFRLGMVVKISKAIKITKKLQFEPELALNPMFDDFITPFVSLGFKFKFGGYAK